MSSHSARGRSCCAGLAALLFEHCAFPFLGTRLQLLRRWLVTQREGVGLRGSSRRGLAAEQLAAAALAGWHNPIEVRRGSLLTDAYSELRGLGRGWRLPLRVRFFSAEGGEEAGVGEGIAKALLLEKGFDPSFGALATGTEGGGARAPSVFDRRASCSGLFATGTEGGLYPDPAARMSHAAARSWYEFLGAVLAKALWEGILAAMQLGRIWFLARSLRLLRDYDGDVEDLCLSFAVDQYTAEAPPEPPGGRTRRGTSF
ncbi:hypothetical protein EMIHUDRAFT_251566 [Emiliania huxleyi CCMP1516]|uniref:HECT-type E3 ubiquitin transferase n=2 Tax=Emiliania huxleyi TaxID=2903 RepID=A0A0D3KTJ9_EMIH1|nr:hypothetical protein EMIHUDRAFT_251566 [Emiliania huxleyi CCMP1516]EOD39084.1 hypothetical protein EMIHUDRAFT_251566 [Emiliania huxleyi CCMP1516]|eukprot:XP_005791513.1 hypothetical protein EMIHUDRAFT_251566 [Emiliania huxleyi CCMP1516]